MRPKMAHTMSGERYQHDSSACLGNQIVEDLVNATDGNRVFAGPVQMISVNGALSPTKQSTAVMAAAISLHRASVFLSNAFDRIQAAS